MLFADDNTLWIGSLLCTQGERYHQGATTNLGCLTMFNTSNNSVTMIDSYKGDATGIAAVTSLHKIYTAEGGQVYIYNTAHWFGDGQLAGDRGGHGLRCGLHGRTER